MGTLKTPLIFDSIPLKRFDIALNFLLKKGLKYLRNIIIQIIILSKKISIELFAFFRFFDKRKVKREYFMNTFSIFTLLLALK